MAPDVAGLTLAVAYLGGMGDLSALMGPPNAMLEGTVGSVRTRGLRVGGGVAQLPWALVRDLQERGRGLRKRAVLHEAAVMRRVLLLIETTRAPCPRT